VNSLTTFDYDLELPILCDSDSAYPFTVYVQFFTNLSPSLTLGFLPPSMDEESAEGLSLQLYSRDSDGFKDCVAGHTVLSINVLNSVNGGRSVYLMNNNLKVNASTGFLVPWDLYK
jgi:hypothetical protein